MTPTPTDISAAVIPALQQRITELTSQLAAANGQIATLNGECQYSRNSIITLHAERTALLDELATLRRLEREAIDEFNAGFAAYKAGRKLSDEPLSTPHDEWRVGYAWAAFAAMLDPLWNENCSESR